MLQSHPHGTVVKQVNERRLGLFQLSFPHLMSFSFRTKHENRMHMTDRTHHTVPVHTSVILRIFWGGGWVLSVLFIYLQHPFSGWDGLEYRFIRKKTAINIFRYISSPLFIY